MARTTIKQLQATANRLGSLLGLELKAYPNFTGNGWNIVIKNPEHNFDSIASLKGTITQCEIQLAAIVDTVREIKKRNIDIRQTE